MAEIVNFRWEYMALPFKYDTPIEEVMSQLNDLGKDGWELVDMRSFMPQSAAVLKRSVAV